MELLTYLSVDNRLVSRRSDRCRRCGRRGVKRIRPAVKVIFMEDTSYHHRRMLFCPGCKHVVMFLDRYEGDTEKGVQVHISGNTHEIKR